MSRDGLRMDPKKISAIRDLDPTQINTLEKIRSFLGLVSYYRRFVAGFSKLAVPLHNLTKDGVDVPTASQTPECQDAIKALINSITSEPVLCTPRFDRPFILKTDAANTEGLGGVLSQHDDEGRERVIGYYGRRLNPHERNYTITEIELLAAVESIKHWRPYLWGREFKLIVDHSALRWLHTMKDTMEGGPASRLMRWILKLAEYNFTVEHKPGVLHKDADGVSRLAAPVLHQRLATLWGDDDPYDHVAAATPGTRGTHQRRRVTTARSLQREARQTLSRSEVTAQFLDTGAPSRQTLVDEQWKDPDCRALIDYINRVGNPDPADADAMRHAVRMHRRVFGKERETGLQLKRRLDVTADGTLIKITPAGARLYVPASLQDALMYAHHDRLGHHSAERTSAALKTTYYWPGLDAAVRDWVNECHHCTLSKPHKTVPRQPTGSTLGHYPFDVVYADILDMAYTANYVKRSKSDAATSAAAQTPAGHRKLIVFVDSLSRWVEAIPLYSDPTSEQVLDIFMEHVVSRHGTPSRHRLRLQPRQPNLPRDTRENWHQPHADCRRASRRGRRGRAVQPDHRQHDALDGRGRSPLVVVPPVPSHVLPGHASPSHQTVAVSLAVRPGASTPCADCLRRACQQRHLSPDRQRQPHSPLRARPAQTPLVRLAVSPAAIAGAAG